MNLIEWLNEKHYPYNFINDGDAEESGSTFLTFPWTDYAVMFKDFDNGYKLAILSSPKDGKIEAKYYTENDATAFLEKLWLNAHLPNRSERRKKWNRRH